ncbi:hypothetical protein H6G76_01995 [Nostoc sp. FACHB-152]|nr:MULTISPECIES: hypothetical protein [unclassified Nostoc]MBD2445944.1 hypothetical protein [Nostoc sp. FACHB-152]MBD2467880.1 hypothetical protein [Nostoc sp. FACHB-145]
MIAMSGEVVYAGDGVDPNDAAVSDGGVRVKVSPRLCHNLKNGQAKRSLF